MDALNEVAGRCIVGPDYRDMLWSAVEDVASVILARYDACGCRAWTGIGISNHGLHVSFFADPTHGPDETVCSLVVSVREVLRSALIGTGQRLLVWLRDAQEFGALVYERFHGIPRHGDCTLLLATY